MEQEQKSPENIKCPYCGADNYILSELCGVCFKDLHIPAEARAEAKAKKVLSELKSPSRPAAPATAGERPAYLLWGRLILIAGLFLFYLQWFREKNHFSFLDHVNLPFHEAGQEPSSRPARW